MHTSELFKISRPRFWLYLAGPYLIGLVAANTSTSALYGFWPLLFLLYFLFPANLLIYGVNDIFDFETDRHNPKKNAYETLVAPNQRAKIWGAIVAANTPFLALLLVYCVQNQTTTPALAVVGFLFFGIFYSAPPIRAKTKPLFDSFFNILYLFPGFVGYALLSGAHFDWKVFFAGTLWVMAMHAYSAIPDIDADKTAKLSTIATVLGATRTLVFCAFCYLGAAVLSYPHLGVFGILLGSMYVGMICLSLLSTNRQWIFRVYRWFPFLNGILGFSIFLFLFFTRH